MGAIAVLACAPSHVAGTSSLAPKIAPAPGTVVFQNPRGAVVFGHDRHRALACARCHPPFDQRFDDAKDYSAVAHEVCTGCHQRAGVPADCSACHRAAPP
jgi:hypothetical protein